MANFRSPPRRNRARLFDLDPRVLDHLAPAFLLATKIAIELLRRTGDHDKALVDAELFESLGLNRRGGRLVEAVDDIGWRPGRRKQAIPALRGIAGNARLGDGGQLRKGRRTLR